MNAARRVGGYLSEAHHGGTSRRYLAEVPLGGRLLRTIREVLHRGTSRRAIAEVPRGASRRVLSHPVTTRGTTLSVAEDKDEYDIVLYEAKLSLDEDEVGYAVLLNLYNLFAL